MKLIFKPSRLNACFPLTDMMATLLALHICHRTHSHTSSMTLSAETNI